ncbi:calcium-binding protein [Palleronia caenipelagi]|uniref:Calcium-binding protein n=1 Tax=Palleronia caenipelagi TaxID=2489174 RepID=A0A547Q548_9RHOB|nr:calcium-binding protein [Palleronia caenipelagi]TRD21520.1 calcium-binding protein [Palleronia caenipelagi]
MYDLLFWANVGIFSLLLLWQLDVFDGDDDDDDDDDDENNEVTTDDVGEGASGGGATEGDAGDGATEGGAGDGATEGDGTGTDGGGEAESANEPTGPFVQDNYEDVRTGTAERDTLTAVRSGPSLAYFGLDGNDFVDATDSDDYLDGGAGADQLLGRFGSDIINGGDGNDTILGGLGSDALYGQAGEDRIDGSRGDDSIFGGSGNDSLEGRGDDDVIYGGDGDDQIFSDSSFDVSNIGRGEDILFGEAGDDLLVLGDGDEATGGEGADRFDVFEVESPDSGAAKINDYTPSEDTITIAHLERTDPATGDTISPTLSTAYNAATDQTTIRLDGTDFIILTGNVDVDLDSITLTPQG